MDFALFKCLVEENFGPTDAGLLGELVSTVESLVSGGSDLFSAIYNTAQEMRDTLLSIQHLEEDFGDEDLTADDEDGDDLCDNCQSSGVVVDQTCPLCGKTLCIECAALNDGLCSECFADGDKDGEELQAVEMDHAAH